MEKIKEFFYKCAGGLSLVSSAGYVFIIGLIVVDVIMEKFLKTPISGTYELIERSMVIAVFASFAYAQTKKAHINMMILIERFPRFSRLLSLGATSVLSVGATGYAAYAAWTQSNSALQMGMMTGTLHIPLWPFYLIQSVALFLMAVILSFDTIHVFAAMKNDKINDMVTEDYGMILHGEKPKKTA